MVTDAVHLAPLRRANIAVLDVRARLRPMGVGDIVDESIRLYREGFLLFLATTAVLLAPVLLVAAVATLLGAATAATGIDNGDGTMGTILGGLGLLSVPLTIAGAAAALVVVAALTVAASERYLGRPVTVRAAYAAGLRRLWPLLLASLWAGVRLIPILVLCAFLIGYPFLVHYAIAWSLIPQAVVLEGCGAGGASKRSRQLVAGHWWKVFGLYLVLAILLNILATVPTLLLGAVVGGAADAAAGPVTAVGVAYAVVGVVVPVLLLPIVFIAATLLFYDLKVRKEAFDLEAMATVAAQRGEAWP